MPTIAPRSLLATLVVLLALSPAWAQDPPAETIVRGGQIVNADGRQTADIRIVGETIAEIGPDLTARDARTRIIDATDRLVVPGGIDPHVHVGPGRVDDYTSGSAAALAGGITTISNFLGVGEDDGLTDPLEAARPIVESQAMADVILHAIVTNPSVGTPDALNALVAEGQPTVKVFMVRPYFEADVQGFVDLMRAAGDAGVLSLMHAEDAALVAAATAQLMVEGRSGLENFPRARPVAAEVAATERAVAMAEITGAPIYLVHLSSARALDVATRAQARGLPVFVETRPIYLHLTAEQFAGPTPGLYIGQPPLRSAEDQEALWQGLAEGSIHVLGSDHVAYAREQKLDPSQTVAQHRAGMSNLQVMLPMLFSEGVGRGRLTAERFVQVTSTNAAKLFGLYPRKGAIAVGSDADVVIWNDAERRAIRDEDMLSNSGYSVHAGLEVTGWPVLTLRRGELVYHDGEILTTPGSGRLVEREAWTAPEL